LYQSQAEKGIFLFSLVGVPQTSNANFLKFGKHLQHGFSFFWNAIFIILYTNFTIKNRSIFNKNFLWKISYILKMLQKMVQILY